MEARNYWPRDLRNLIARQGFIVTNMGFALAVFEVYPWLPAFIIKWYHKAMPQLEKIPFLRKLLSASVFIVGQKPGT